MMRYRVEAFEIEVCSQDGKYRRGGKDSGAGDKRLKRKYKKRRIQGRVKKLNKEKEGFRSWRQIK